MNKELSVGGTTGYCYGSYLPLVEIESQQNRGISTCWKSLQLSYFRKEELLLHTSLSHLKDLAQT